MTAETRKARERRLLELASVGQLLPGSVQDRAMCKVLVIRGLLEPDGCMGYRLSPETRRERVAYTLGNEENYDRLLAECDGDVLRKTGKGDRGRDPNYSGGWVWRTAAEAEAFRCKYGFHLLAVYELVLPGAWDACTHRGGPSDGETYLLADAVIVRKVRL